VEFGVLGPLEVRTDGRTVPVSAGKQRVLLAALLLRANQVVGVDALAEAVWEGRPPGTSLGDAAELPHAAAAGVRPGRPRADRDPPGAGT